MEQAVNCPLKDEHLVSVPIEHTTWADWKNQHPLTKVLSRDTGFRHDYGRSPYGDTMTKMETFISRCLSTVVSTTLKSA